MKTLLESLYNLLSFITEDAVALKYGPKLPLHLLNAMNHLMNEIEHYLEEKD